MKGNAKLIESLNQILTAELTGINQYFIHSMMCRNWGFHRLAGKIREQSIGEMKHAEELIERILHLEGLPNVQKVERIKVGKKVLDQLKFDLDLETAAIRRLNDSIALAREVADNTTRDMLVRIVNSEDEHQHWLESQLELISQVGEQNYLTQQIG